MPLPLPLPYPPLGSGPGGPQPPRIPPGSYRRSRTWRPATCRSAPSPAGPGQGAAAGPGGTRPGPAAQPRLAPPRLSSARNGRNGPAAHAPSAPRHGGREPPQWRAPEHLSRPTASPLLGCLMSRRPQTPNDYGNKLILLIAKNVMLRQYGNRGVWTPCSVQTGFEVKRPYISLVWSTLDRSCLIKLSLPLRRWCLVNVVLMPCSSASSHSQSVNVHMPVKYMKNWKLSIKPFSSIEEKDGVDGQKKIGEKKKRKHK